MLVVNEEGILELDAQGNINIMLYQVNQVADVEVAAGGVFVGGDKGRVGGIAGGRLVKEKVEFQGWAIIASVWDAEMLPCLVGSGKWKIPFSSRLRRYR
jgi:hypothetical protein